MYFIDRSGNYYEGDQASPLDIYVPQRPAPDYTWRNGEWLPYEPTAEERLGLLEPALRKHLDETCALHGFDNYQSAMNWAGFPNPYQVDAHVLAEWVAACWGVHFDIMSEIQSTHATPAVNDYLSRLPGL
jgi:hypothetical protein